MKKDKRGMIKITSAIELPASIKSETLLGELITDDNKVVIGHIIDATFDEDSKKVLVTCEIQSRFKDKLFAQIKDGFSMRID